MNHFGTRLCSRKIERRHRAASSCRISLPPLLFWRNFQKGRRMNKREERHFFIWFSFSHQSTSSVKKEARYNSSYPVNIFSSIFCWPLWFSLLESGGRKIERTRRTELRADDESCYHPTGRTAKRQRRRPFCRLRRTTKGRENSTLFSIKKKERKKSFFPMTFSPFTFDVSHLFCLFNSIRLSIFHQKVHQIRKLAHYYYHTCLSTEHKKKLFDSPSTLFLFSFHFPREGTNERSGGGGSGWAAKECVCGKVEKEEATTNETRKALTQK